MDEALDEIEGLAGTKFDPAVAEAFLRLHGRKIALLRRPSLARKGPNESTTVGLSRCPASCVMGSLGACASAPPQGERFAPPATYAEAMAALEAGDQTEGRAKLAQVLEVCGTTALGERAAVALIADALDPRHADLDLAASLSRAYLSQPYRTPPVEQLATSAYLVSIDFGGSLE